MKYKTTYFTISLNTEISVFESTYKYRINTEKLYKEITELESEVEKIYKKNGVNINLSNIEITNLEAISNSEHEIYKEEPQLLSQVYSRINQLLFRKGILRDLNEQRFTKYHEQELNNHLNENAKEGWNLFSMNPIEKGYKDYDYYNGYRSAYGYGFGHNVLEGFVLVWEKNE